MKLANKKIEFIGLGLLIISTHLVLYLAIIRYMFIHIIGFYLAVPAVLIVSAIAYVLLNALYKSRHYAKIQLLPYTQNGLDTSIWSNIISTHKIVIGIVLSIIFVYAVGLIESFVHSYKDNAGNEINILKYIFSGTRFYNYFMLAPGVAEEVIMRAGLLHLFLVLKRPKLGIVVSSSIFGIIHIIPLLFSNNIVQLSDAIWIVNITIMGVFLAYLYMRFGLITAMFLHWFWNAAWYNLMTKVEQSVTVPVLAVAVIIVCELLIGIHTQRMKVRKKIVTVILFSVHGQR